MASDVLPPEKEVDCPCDFRYERPLGLDPTGTNFRATTCLRCGALTLIVAGVDEPRAGDIRNYGNHPLPCSEPLRAWFDAWPRHGRIDGQSVFLPVGVRVASLDQLAALEADAWVEQQALAPLERLVRLGFPPQPAPEPLRGDFQVYSRLWRQVRDYRTVQES